jgi:hypothetical protein
MQPPYAQLRASLNGGAPLRGGIIAPAGATCQLSADPGGLAGAFALRYEMLDVPVGWSLPSGWQVDAAGVYFSTEQDPPEFTLPDASLWGKIMLRLTLNYGVSPNSKVLPVEQLIDTTCALSVVSASGLKDLGFNEEGQFSALKLWTKDHKDNLRILDSFIAGGGGGGGLVVTGTPQLNYVPMWNGSGAVWAPVDGVKILSFSPVVSLVETGQSVVHPAFTASYNITPTAATLTNDANAESLDVHLTPTSFASAQTYVKNTPNLAVNFTLSASVGALAATPVVRQIIWGQKTYGAVAAAGATMATILGGSVAYAQLATTRAANFSLTDDATHRMHFFQPTRYTGQIFKDTATGFALGVTVIETANVTNAQGFTESYTHWQLDNPYNGTLGWSVT